MTRNHTRPFKRLGLELTLLSLGLLAAPRAHADFFIHSWDDHHENEHVLLGGAEFLYYHSGTNYDSAGNTFTPFGLNSYQRALLDFNGTYGLTQSISLFARVSWEMAKVDSTNPAAFVGTSYGLGDQSLGLNYRVYEKEGSFSLDLQAQADFAGYKNSDAQGVQSPILGDGTFDFTLGSFITVPMAQRQADDISLIGGLGYTIRNSGYSAAVPWSINARLAPKSQGVLLNLGLYGFMSLKTDANTNNTTLVNSSTASVGSGGSYITNAINPSLINVGGTLGYLTSNDILITGTLAQSVWGREAPNGYILGLGIQTHFGHTAGAGGNDPRDNDPIFQSASKYGHTNKGYVNYNLEAKVLRANDRFNLIKIDKGSSVGIRPGDTFDIFLTKPDGTTGAAIARGRVTSVKAEESALKIEEYFKEVWIEEGFVARRPIE